MVSTQKLILAVIVAVLAIGGAIWTPYREKRSVCDDSFYTALVHDEMRAELIEESAYLKAFGSRR